MLFMLNVSAKHEVELKESSPSFPVHDQVFSYLRLAPPLTI